MHPKNFPVLLLLVVASACQKKVADHLTAPEGFESVPVAKPIVPGILDEASGIADSKINPGYLWVEQDSGNPNDIALLSHGGHFLKNINIGNAVNRDWEAMVIANGPLAGINYIFLADIGDNNLADSQYCIYRFAEPEAATGTVSECDKINFKYPDGAHNAEAILVDNNTKDIYIITKQDNPSRIYKLVYPQNTSSVSTAVLCGTLSFNNVTAAALSPDGKEVLIRTYNTIYYWKKNDHQTLEQVLVKIPVSVPIQFEPQGEAICFKNDNSGFFTLSERPSVIAAVNLNFYKRK
ncbi:MAG: hypothetical protein ACXWWC_06860 [Chitinophagaceae bacterium]